nr:MAG TPA: Oligo alginate lyase [Caudoviricetes sp.]
MATLADLPLGAIILIPVGTEENRQCEVADKNNLVSGGAVLVYKNAYEESEFGNSTLYPDGTLDNLIKNTIFNSFPQTLREKMIDVTFALKGSNSITRKMFALTYTMAGFGNNGGVAEGKALQYYTSNNRRIKKQGGASITWWLSSQDSSEYAWYIYHDGTAYNKYFGPSSTKGVVPAFVIPQSTQLEDDQNQYGNYFIKGLLPNDKITVTTVKPKNTYAGSWDTINFEWTYASREGLAQKKYELQYKDTSHTDWTALASAESANTNVNIPPNTFAAGIVKWRVRCTNANNQVSAWSEEASFTAQGKPSTPTVSATASPRPVITWTGEGQLAYQVKVDDAVLRTAYSTDGRYKVKEYLADGAHIAAVRIQNEYGLWSDWGTAEFTVANTPGAPITLFAAGGEKAALAWTETDHKTYYIYRDDIPIAKTTAHTYSDQMAIGTHKYKVRGVAGDNYSMSNEVTVTLSVDAPEIAALGEMQWLRLEYSTAQNSPLGVSAYQDVAYQFYAGRRYPVAETSQQITKIYSFNAAFNDAAQAAAFEGLLGKTVIYRDQHGCLCTGPLMGFELSADQFFRAFSCSIQQTDNNERIEHD